MCFSVTEKNYFEDRFICDDTKVDKFVKSVKATGIHVSFYHPSYFIQPSYGYNFLLQYFVYLVVVIPLIRR
jgi:hypothetical protein